MLKTKQKKTEHESTEIFEKNYQDYCSQIEKINLEAIKNTLEIKKNNDGYLIPFFNGNYQIINNEIVDLSGNRPDYMVSVILAKYILLSPEKHINMEDWVSFKDFKKAAGAISAGTFAGDTERRIAKHFSGRLEKLKTACEKSGGIPNELGTSYDLSMKFQALPRISILLLFNDSDETFPAKSTLLFQKHAEYYLDPESLIMLLGFFCKLLKKNA